MTQQTPVFAVVAAIIGAMFLIAGTVYSAADPARDSDNDGLSDIDEATLYRTDSQLADTDADGLNDAEEINVYFTNPLLRDSDGDGFLDGVEVRNHSDPTDAGSVPSRDIQDLDGDGLSNREESNSIGSDPQLVDSDFDGLTDGDEVHKYFTNPVSVDTDGDTFWDGEEVKAGTDPGDVDSHP